jgi:hypothetical protein
VNLTGHTGPARRDNQSGDTDRRALFKGLLAFGVFVGVFKHISGLRTPTITGILVIGLMSAFLARVAALEAVRGGESVKRERRTWLLRTRLGRPTGWPDLRSAVVSAARDS